MQQEMLKWGAAIFISFFVIKELFGMLKKKGDYVLKDDCKSFRSRIGKESDDHQKCIMDLKNDITEIKEGVAYLKGKAGQ